MLLTLGHSPQGEIQPDCPGSQLLKVYPDLISESSVAAADFFIALEYLLSCAYAAIAIRLMSLIILVASYSQPLVKIA